MSSFFFVLYKSLQLKVLKKNVALVYPVDK
jgi:hypothetical protein